MSNVIEFPDKQGLSDEEIERRAEPLADAITALLEEQPISVRWAALTNVLIGTYFDFDKILMKHSNGILGIWIEQTEGAKFCRHIWWPLSELDL